MTAHTQVCDPHHILLLRDSGYTILAGMRETACIYWARSNADGLGQRSWLMLPCSWRTEPYSCWSIHSTAVEEQNATTNEMARNVSEAARGSSEITQNIAGVAQAAEST